MWRKNNEATKLLHTGAFLTGWLALSCHRVANLQLFVRQLRQILLYERLPASNAAMQAWNSMEA
jgi:hypothetical protein